MTRSAKAAPTVPRPRTPILKTSGLESRPAGIESLGIATRQVGVSLAPDDDAGIASPAEDDRRARHPVVVVRHRVTVGAGGRRHDDVAGRRVCELDVLNDHVT